MTVAQLSCHLTHEELLGWAAFFELRAEQEEQAHDRAKMQGKAQSVGRR
ncbi:hypothetical protein [uncultured Mediterranean phage uvMED]|nr:hypothetical protein [uncultured Mediterranean phage uvMED]BAR22955.1 hypothetical protein [uncultured Mediterranean phage uvMED]BAR22992.1 hypothetical protein [uncultured Mediterranean phage uvMED]BAR23016.1 hypothetical protein [uncultured Mediterranean phage uvMED]BAR23060.1 hypothetical protein [uncultured Mediterranean phage uvMED]